MAPASSTPVAPPPTMTKDSQACRRPGRDLVKQRLKKMEVAAVDQRHMHGRVLQPPGGMQAAEAAADDYDMGKPVHLGHVLDPKSCIEAKVTFTNGLRKTKFRPSWTSRSLLAQKKVSGTFGRSKLQHFLRLE